MLRSSPLVSASLMVAFAAGVAGVFTIATDASSNDQTQIQRSAKSDLADQTDLRSIFFDSQPIAGSGRISKEPEATDAHGAVSQQIAPEQTNDLQDRSKIKNGCESGLSPDISPTVPLQPGRCIASYSAAKYASLR